MSDSSRPHGLQPTRFLRPWDFPGKSTGVGCHCLLLVIHINNFNIEVCFFLLQWLYPGAFYSMYIQPKNKEETPKQKRAGKTLDCIRIGVLAPYYHRILNRWHIYAFQSSQILENFAAQESTHEGGWRIHESIQSLCFSNWQKNVTHSYVTTLHKDAHKHPIFYPFQSQTKFW